MSSYVLSSSAIMSNSWYLDLDLCTASLVQLTFGDDLKDNLTVAHFSHHPPTLKKNTTNNNNINNKSCIVSHNRPPSLYPPHFGTKNNYFQIFNSWQILTLPFLEREW